MKKIITFLLVFVLMISIIGNDKVFATTEEGVLPETETPQTTQEVPTIFAQATVIEVGEIKELHTENITHKVQEVKIEILEGEYETKEFVIEYILSNGTGVKNKNYELKIGDKVKVQIAKDENENVTATVQDVVRKGNILILFVIFLLTILLISGKQGIKTVLSLLVVIFSIYYILVKGIYVGHNAIFMTILTVIIIALIHSILTIGFTKKALAVILGTLCSVMVSGMLTMIFSHFAKISGIREETIMFNVDNTTLNFAFKDLIFVGSMISSLGICMNVALLLVSRMEEAKSKTEDMSWQQLFKTGMNFKGELIGSIVHTVVLLYMGSSLIILFMFLACNIEIGEILDKETVAEIAVSAIGCSIGAIVSVVITAIIYSILSHRKSIYKTTSENKLDGNRSLKL